MRIFALWGALALLTSGAQAQSANPIVSSNVIVSASTACLPARSLSSGVVLKAGPNNAGTVFVGGSSDLANSPNWYPLNAGEAISYGATSLSAVCYLGQNTSDQLYFTGN